MASECAHLQNVCKGRDKNNLINMEETCALIEERGDKEKGKMYEEIQKKMSKTRPNAYPNECPWNEENRRECPFYECEDQ